MLPLPPYLNAVARLHRILNKGCSSSCAIPEVLTEPLWGSAVVSRLEGTLRTTPQYTSTVIAASVSMDPLSHERLHPLDVAAGAVTPAYLPATATDLPPTYSMKTSMAVTSIASAPPTRKECKVSRLSSMPAALKSSLEVRGHLRSCQRQNPSHLRFLGRLGTEKPEPSASAHCMDAGACRYAIVAATVQISRLSVIFLTTTAWEDSRSVLPKRKLKMNFSLPGICNTCGVTRSRLFEMALHRVECDAEKG